MSETHSPESFAVKGGGVIDRETGAVVPPVHLATTYERDADNAYRRGFAYARPDNPTASAVEAVIARLEGASRAMVLSSGMAAATSIFLSLERPAHVVAPRVMYWGLRRWLSHDAHAFGIEASFVDTTDPAAIEAACKLGNTRLVWLETPSNPTWCVSDIARAADIAHRFGAVLAVDSTVATPVHTRPVSLGADIVMHSATKYLNGHSDVLAGALAFAREDSLTERIAGTRAALGAILGPFEASLLLRGLRTLHLRVRHQSTGAMGLAERLSRNAHIVEVLYPGLPSHPGHALAARQMSGGFGGMLSVRVRGGEAAAIATAAGVRVWLRATSLGGVESLIEHRASVEGAGSPCPPDLLRLSVGLEPVDELADDLEQALATAHE